MNPRRPVLLTVVATLVAAAPAYAAGPYYVEPGPSAHHGLPCDVLNPCAIDWALDATHLPAGSTVLVEAGNYDVSASPPDVVQPLTIEADPAATTIPVIASGGSFQPVLKFDTGSDGSRLTGVDVAASGLAKPALDVVVPATIDHVAIASATTAVTLTAAATLSDATVSADGSTALGIDAAPTATVRATTISATGSPSAIGIVDEAANAGGGQVTDTTVRSDGAGVQAGGGAGPGAVMRRLNIAATGTGAEEESGPATLTDSLVTSTSGDGLQADDGTLIARNDTVIAPAGDALHALASPLLGIFPGTVDVRNTIARGATDALAEPATGANADGVIDIAHSNFVTRSRVTDLGANQSADPMFVSPVLGDFHLLAPSPAIDAGIDDPADGPTDLAGHPRIQGAAPDIGAYEAAPIPAIGPPPPPPVGVPSPPPTPRDTVPPAIRDLTMTHRRVRLARGTAFRFTVSEAARVTIAIAAQKTGRRHGAKCLAPSRRLARARRCTRLVARGSVIKALPGGAASVVLSGRVSGHRLAPGRYRATLTAVDAAGNRSAPRSITFTVVAR